MRRHVNTEYASIIPHVRDFIGLNPVRTGLSRHYTVNFWTVFEIQTVLVFDFRLDIEDRCVVKGTIKVRRMMAVG